MSGRSSIPPGKAGLVVLAVATLPILLKKCKPLVKVVGSGLTKFGEAMTKAAEEPMDPVKTEAKVADEVKPKPKPRPKPVAKTPTKPKPKTPKS